MKDLDFLLEAANAGAAAVPASPPLRHFVDQLRSAHVSLDLAPDDIEESVASASLTLPDEDGAIRTIVGAGRVTSIGVYPSAKSGLLQPYEGRTERALIHWCEADGTVPHYQSQPCILRYRTPWGHSAWIVDLWRQLADGTIEMVEVKRTPNDLRKPGYAAKLACAAASATSLGYRFRLMFRDEIRGNVHRRRNVARVQARRNGLLSDGALERFEEAAAAGALLSVGDVRRAVHHEPLRGMAGVHRLVARGHVLVDLDSFLCDASPVVIAGPIPASRIHS